MGLTSAQLASVKKAIKRTTATDAIKITQNGPNATIEAFRLGRDGYQVIETTVGVNGSRGVIQKAYDSHGKLVHYDRKK